ncbi:MAG: GNAT family N-acetyltransferase [Bacillota bacterium]
MIEIRPCQPDDLPGVFNLLQQLHPADSTSYNDVCKAFDTLTGHPGAKVYVARSDSQVVGTFTLYIIPNLTRNGRPAAILENLIVHSCRRGQGIGRAMLDYARRLAEETGCYKLSLTSNIERTEAHRFYEKCGMIRHGFSFRYVL